MALFRKHLTSLQTGFSDLKRQAQEQSELLIGTPGSVTRRIVSGRPFYYRQYYDVNGTKSADYVGPADTDEGERAAAAMRERIEVANALLLQARALVRAGYVRTDAKTDAVLVALANNGLFRAGGVLVGSHAYGALLNDLGVLASSHATEDVDFARDRALRLEGGKSFAEMLADSKLKLHEVPQLDRKKPSTSFKPPGADRLRIDLLVPTEGDEVKVLEVRDLKGHAMGMPFLRYLLQDPVATIVIGRSAIIPVNVPRPERLAWHKMLVSELRNRESDKKTKDLEQAAVLVAVLADAEPGALEDAFRALPRKTKNAVSLGAAKVRSMLAARGHTRAAELLGELVPQLERRAK